MTAFLLAGQHISVVPCGRPIPQVVFSQLKFPGVERPFVDDDSMAAELVGLLRGQPGSISVMKVEDEREQEEFESRVRDLLESPLTISVRFAGGQLELDTDGNHEMTDARQPDGLYCSVSFSVEDVDLAVRWSGPSPAQEMR